MSARILYVAARPPYPLRDGLAMRQYNILRAYARWGAIHLVFLHTDPVAAEHLEAMSRYCATLHPVALSSTAGESRLPRYPAWRRALAWTLTLDPAVVTSSASEEMRRIVDELLPSVDLVHVHRLQMAVQVAHLLSVRGRRQRFVLDLDDVETVAQARRLKHAKSRGWARTAFDHYDWLRLWWYQTRAVRRFDRVFVCSRDDQERLAKHNVIVIPNGVTVPADEPKNDPQPGTMLFCGQLSYGPNVDGVQFFVRRILPLIRREVPDASLLVVGRAPSPEVRALHDGRTVRVEADVPSVTKYYRTASIAIAPLRMGGGTRIKILEAWALGVAVVSTPIGCEGLDGVDGQHLRVAANPEAFAQACIDLLRDPSLRTPLVMAGRKLVLERYRWECVAAQAIAAAKELLNDR